MNLEHNYGDANVMHQHYSSSAVHAHDVVKGYFLFWHYIASIPGRKEKGLESRLLWHLHRGISTRGAFISESDKKLTKNTHCKINDSSQIYNTYIIGLLYIHTHLPSVKSALCTSHPLYIATLQQSRIYFLRFQLIYSLCIREH